MQSASRQAAACAHSHLQNTQRNTERRHMRAVSQRSRQWEQGGRAAYEHRHVLHLHFLAET